MSANLNHHYVPQFYFRNFSEDGKRINLLLRRNGRAVSDASIKDQASKRNFYGSAATDQTLAKVEERFSEAIRYFRGTGDFDKVPGDLYAYLLGSILIQKARTATARRRTKAGRDRMFQLLAEVSITNSESLDEAQKKEALEQILALESNAIEDQLLRMKVASTAIPTITDLTPIMLHNKTKRPFIFGDAPVVLTNPLLQRVSWRGVLGLRTVGLIILYPLDPKKCAMLTDLNSYRVKKLKNSILAVRRLEDVSAINRLQIHNASDAVYFHDFEHSDYVRRLWREENKNLTDHEGKVFEGQGFTPDGEEIGEIVHLVEEQLNFIPRLSFLTYAESSAVRDRFASPRIPA